MTEKQEDKRIDFCLLIPCYNNSQGLEVSLASVRYRQGNYLIVVVDDGSTQPVVLKKNDYQHDLHLIRLSRNRGITGALNAGLEWICKNTDCRYIARLDCSDVSHETRFQKQVQYLDAHPQTGLLGSWCLFRNPQSKKDAFIYRAPATNRGIRRAMHLRNVFLHPSVMFRTELLHSVGFYSDQYLYAEDYALFWAMLGQSEGAVLPEVLVTCALEPGGISATYRKVQLMSCEKIIRRFGTDLLLRKIGRVYTKIRMMVPAGLMTHMKRNRGFMQGLR
ncbi:MAG: glycosyltransferase [Chitinophagaceae bacterium]